MADDGVDLLAKLQESVNRAKEDRRNQTTAPLHQAPDAEERIEFLLYEHREDALECHDHPEAYCCVCGEHEVGSYRKHVTKKVARLIENAVAERALTEADIREQVLTEYANLPVAASERAVLNLTAERDALRERLAGVEALEGFARHVTTVHHAHGNDCGECGDWWPCLTFRMAEAALHPTEADR